MLKEKKPMKETSLPRHQWESLIQYLRNNTPMAYTLWGFYLLDTYSKVNPSENTSSHAEDGGVPAEVANEYAPQSIFIQRLSTLIPLEDDDFRFLAALSLSSPIATDFSAFFQSADFKKANARNAEIWERLKEEKNEA